MLKNISKIDGSQKINKRTQRHITGGLPYYVSSCSPEYNGALCKMENGQDGRCVDFMCCPYGD